MPTRTAAPPATGAAASTRHRSARIDLCAHRRRVRRRARVVSSGRTVPSAAAISAIAARSASLACSSLPRSRCASATLLARPSAKRLYASTSPGAFASSSATASRRCWSPCSPQLLGRVVARAVELRLGRDDLVQQLALTVVLPRFHVGLRDRVRLAERPASLRRHDDHARGGRALYDEVPFLGREVGLACHASSSRSSGRMHQFSTVTSVPMGV